MATVNFSVPEDVKASFNRAFKGRNKSAVIAELMREAVDRVRRRQESRAAVDSPWRKSPLHSTGVASRLTSLLVGCICPICALLTPCQAGAPPVSVRRGVSPRAVERILTRRRAAPFAGGDVLRKIRDAERL